MTTAIIIIAIIIVLLLIFALIIGNKMKVERTISINKPLQPVFDYLKYVKNHENFSVWTSADPEMKKEYRGTDGQEGFVYKWDSTKVKNIGAGEQEIRKIEVGKNIEHELRFFRPMQNVAQARFVFNPVTANQTDVKWGFYSQMKYPMNIMKYVLQKMLSKDLEKGLQNLKVVLEKQN